MAKKKKKECHLIKFKDKSKEQVDLNSQERGNHIISIGKKKRQLYYQEFGRHAIRTKNIR